MKTNSHYMAIQKTNFFHTSILLLSFVATSYLNPDSLASLVLLYIVFTLLYIILKQQHNSFIKKEIKYLQNRDSLNNFYKELGCYVRVNKKFKINYKSEEFINLFKDHNVLHIEENFIDILERHVKNREIIKSITQSIKKNHPFKGLVELKIKDKFIYLDIFIYEISKTPLQESEYIVICNNITKHVFTERELKNHFLVDALTYLPTRLKLLDDIKNIREKHHLHFDTLLYIHIDSYEEINEFFGIDIGNTILKKVSIWLSQNLPTQNSKLYKFEHNNFAIFITDRFGYTSLEKYLKKITTNITKTPIEAKNTNFDISFTIGVSRDKEDILRHAYLALKEAQRSKKSFKIFNKKFQEEKKFLQNIETNRMVKKAIENNLIIPFFQPILNLKTNKIEKFESLIRIKENGKIQRPNDFLEIAKKSKLYGDLTKIMVANSLEQLNIIKHPISINISIEDIVDTKIANFILRKVAQHKYPHFITFEILESDKIENYKRVETFLKKLKALNCKVSIDDFGSGYSNFEQMLKLNVDYIKFDGSLIKNIITNKENELVVKTIVSFAKELKIQTVAEFVYNNQILNKVRELNIDHAQGYQIGKPMPLAQIQKQFKATS